VKAQIERTLETFGSSVDSDPDDRSTPPVAERIAANTPGSERVKIDVE
jgi:hypothetical protein